MRAPEEVQMAVGSLISTVGLVEKAEVEVKRRKHKGFPALEIRLVKMYERPVPAQYEGNLLKFFDAIKAAAGTENLDLVYDVSNPGCETCDWGSAYGWEFVAWDEVNAP